MVVGGVRGGWIAVGGDGGCCYRDTVAVFAVVVRQCMRAMTTLQRASRRRLLLMVAHV